MRPTQASRARSQAQARPGAAAPRPHLAEDHDGGVAEHRGDGAAQRQARPLRAGGRPARGCVGGQAPAGAAAAPARASARLSSRAHGGAAGGLSTAAPSASAALATQGPSSRPSPAVARRSRAAACPTTAAARAHAAGLAWPHHKGPQLQRIFSGGAVQLGRVALPHQQRQLRKHTDLLPHGLCRDGAVAARLPALAARHAAAQAASRAHSAANRGQPPAEPPPSLRRRPPAPTFHPPTLVSPARMSPRTRSSASRFRS